MELEILRPINLKLRTTLLFLIILRHWHLPLKERITDARLFNALDVTIENFLLIPLWKRGSLERLRGKSIQVLKNRILNVKLLLGRLWNFFMKFRLLSTINRKSENVIKIADLPINSHSLNSRQ
jgi:hypothetical protein